MKLGSEDIGIRKYRIPKSSRFFQAHCFLCRHLNSEHHGFILSTQILRSGTSIGANIAEARYGSSRKDFAAKIYIALKECAETLYWLELLYGTDYLSEEEYASLHDDCEILRRMLSATTRSIR